MEKAREEWVQEGFRVCRLRDLMGGLSAAWVTACLGLGFTLGKLARKVLGSFVYIIAKRVFQ